MNGPSWRLVFDASHGGDSVTSKLLLLALAAPIVAIVVCRWAWARPSVRERWLVCAGMILAMLSVLGLALVHGALDHSRAEAARSGKCAMHEGTVQVLQQEPQAGHGPHERIGIAGTVLEFSQFSSGRFYHQTSSHGGALTEGVHARVCVLRGSMVRVEVADAAGGER